MRQVLAVFAGAAVAAFGGLILGEYPFTGVTPYIAGVLFALVVAEVVLAISRHPGPGTAVAAAVCTTGGLGWALWISSGQGLAPVPAGGWAALVIGAAVALIRGGAVTMGGRQGGHSR
jgi:hypothetical protein